MSLAVFSPIFLALACSVCASGHRASIGEPRMCCRYLFMKAVTDGSGWSAYRMLTGRQASLMTASISWMFAVSSPVPLRTICSGVSARSLIQ